MTTSNPCPSLIQGLRPLFGRIWTGLAIVAGGLGGCGGPSDAPPIVKVYEVKGKVELAGGKPLGGGLVVFVPADGLMTSKGKIGADGTFSISTGASGEGAPVGEYKVRIEPEELAVFSAKKGAAKKPPFPQKYTDEEKSGLTATVKAQPNQLEPFQLK